MIRNVMKRHAPFRTGIPVITRRLAHTPVKFNWQDPLDAASRFSEEELAISETAKAYCQEQLLPRILGSIPWLEGTR